MAAESVPRRSPPDTQATGSQPQSDRQGLVMGSLTDDCGALGLAELRHHSPEPLDDRVLGTLPSVLAVVLRNALEPV